MLVLLLYGYRVARVISLILHFFLGSGKAEYKIFQGSTTTLFCKAHDGKVHRSMFWVSPRGKRYRPGKHGRYVLIHVNDFIPHHTCTSRVRGQLTKQLQRKERHIMQQPKIYDKPTNLEQM